MAVLTENHEYVFYPNPNGGVIVVKRQRKYRNWIVVFDNGKYTATRYNRKVESDTRTEVEAKIRTIEDEHLRYLMGEEDISPFER